MSPHDYPGTVPAKVFDPISNPGGEGQMGHVLRVQKDGYVLVSPVILAALEFLVKAQPCRGSVHPRCCERCQLIDDLRAEPS